MLKVDGIKNENVWDFYEKIKPLGSGSYATVFKAKSKANNNEVAIKLILRRDIKGKEEQRLHTEAQIMLKVDHPHVVKCYEIYQDEETLNFVLEYVATGDLFEHVTTVGHFSEVTTSSLIGQLLSALEYLHSIGISHRDLKVENILCRNDGNSLFILVADFGLSKQNSEGLMTQVGSLEYAAPEIFLSKPYNNKCDVWSTGVITFILLTGHFPFHGREPSATLKLIKEGKYKWGEFENEISDQGKEFVAFLLQSDPKKRPTATEASKHSWIAERELLPKHSHLHRSKTQELLKNFKNLTS